MPKVRHTAEVHVSDVVAPVVPKPRATPVRGPKLTVEQMNSLAVRTALKIAGGDASRLRFETDGSVLVTNRARS